MIRDFQKLKTLEDYWFLDEPLPVKGVVPPRPLVGNAYLGNILRMLIRPKYGKWTMPPQVSRWLGGHIRLLAAFDQLLTGIQDSWVYLTIRYGPAKDGSDSEWHFDGSSFRVELIPERNYVLNTDGGTEWAKGNLLIPSGFDPLKHSLFRLAAKQMEETYPAYLYPGNFIPAGEWNMLSPFVLHRRSPHFADPSRIFLRVCFTDVEGRDINNTQNPLLPTDAFGRDPVKSFRDGLKEF